VSADLADAVRRELTAPAPAFAAAFAAELAERRADVLAVLFYGSALRTGETSGVLDFYVLTRALPGGLKGVASRVLWPDVSYCEHAVAGATLRAKIATMTLEQFQRAAKGRGIDTTIWTRFVQPAVLAWSDGQESADRVIRAVTEAAKTAACFAAALGPRQGPASAFWQSLFRQTYAAEFRVERGRELAILAPDPQRYDLRLPQAWRAAAMEFGAEADGSLAPRLSPAKRRGLLRAWRLRRMLGRPLNVARLIKAAFTFDGAARYAVWKVERHTGVALPLTPWRERHPILAAPGAAWRLWRARRRNQAEAR
jgi:hypothetical protein